MPSDNSNLYENICDKLNSIISFKNNIKGYMETYITDGNPTGIHDLSEISEDNIMNEDMTNFKELGLIRDSNALHNSELNTSEVKKTDYKNGDMHSACSVGQ